MIDIKHLGDITKISGYTAPIVDCIIGGSPCQDLSVAGKRAGLDGERSGLYIEQVRIVKEMRERDVRNGRSGVDVRPRYMVWENVPGAFSSNKGEDFRIVLEEIAKVCDKDAVIPMPDKGKWTNCGCVVGDGWSVAWRVLDAQFWGVPQRRRRIALVADFGGQSAPEILLVSKGVSGNTDEGKQKRKGAASDAQGSLGEDDCIGVDIYDTALTGDKVNTLVSMGNNSTGLSPKVMTPITYGINSHNSNAMLSSNPHRGIYEADTSRTLDLNGGNPSCNQGGIAIVQPLCQGLDVYNQELTGDKAKTLTSIRSDADHCPCVVAVESVPYTLKIRSGCDGGGKGSTHILLNERTFATNNDQYLFQPVYSVENHPADSRVGINDDGRAQSATDNETWVESETANTLNAFDVGDVRTTEAVVYALDRASFNQGKNAQYDFEVSDKGINSSLVAKGPSAVAYVDTSHADDVVRMDETVAPLQARDYRGGKLIATRYIVRRLTPLECERLQGYPDGWTLIGEPTEKVVEEFDEDTGEKTGEHIEQEFYYTNSQGKRVKCSDAARYKALGNSIALPPWKWVLKRLCACYERDATMASLFDGIGGFPYLWEQLNGKGSCLWASEIEEFPMAVTKVRIGE